MTTPEDPFPTVHDCYLKQYQLGMPNLSRRYTTILFDEAQDSNPVTSSIRLQQHCKVILVGDRHQQIYRFRGANNALDSKDLAGADQLYLTHSWRFGRNVAIVANALLELKGRHYRLSVEERVIKSLCSSHRTSVTGPLSIAL